MRDTTPEFQAFVDEQYRRLTPAERVQLCTQMFDTARVLFASTLPEGLDERERQRRICEHFYGADFADRVFKDSR